MIALEVLDIYVVICAVMYRHYICIYTFTDTLQVEGCVEVAFLRCGHLICVSVCVCVSCALAGEGRTSHQKSCLL